MKNGSRNTPSKVGAWLLITREVKNGRTTYQTRNPAFKTQMKSGDLLLFGFPADMGGMVYATGFLDGDVNAVFNLVLKVAGYREIKRPFLRPGSPWGPVTPVRGIPAAKLESLITA
jgi:hypothetical protein